MLTTRFPPDYGGGARHALRLCHKLTERGIRTMIITGHRGRKTIDSQVEGIPVTRIPMPASESIGLLPAYIHRLSVLYSRRDEYDLIHAHGIHHYAYAGFLTGKLLGKPAIAKIATLGHDDPASIARRRLGWFQLIMLYQTDLLVAISQEMAHATKEFGWPADKLAYIPNGVNIDLFHPVSAEVRAKLRTQLKLPIEGLIVTFVGSISRRKGVRQLAKIWPQIKKAHPRALLLLVGPCSKQELKSIDEKYVADIKATLASGGVLDSVCFTGQVARPELYLQSSDLFVFPSRREGMPNALLEAMACGLPAAATQLGCIQEMAPPEQQPYLVPKDDIKALAKAIIDLADDPVKRRAMGIAARQAVKERYALDIVADRYIRLYHKLLAR